MICFALITRNTSFLDNSNLCLTIFLTLHSRYQGLNGSVELRAKFLSK